MFKRVLAIVASVVCLAWAAPASADTLLFDPDGTAGGAVTIDSLDPKPGNSLTLGLDLENGDFFGTVLFQANLGTGDLGGATQFTSCEGGADCFTLVAAIDVVVIAADDDSVILGLDASGDSVFNLYANTFGDNLAGTGFTTGDLIATGEFTSFAALFTVGCGLDPDTFTCAITTDNLDNFNADNYNNIDSIIAGGTLSDGALLPLGGGSFSGQISLDVSSLDPDYFLTQVTSLLFKATSQNVVPFGQVDPSALFSSDAVANGDVVALNNAACATTLVGCVNGFGDAVILQTDSNVSLEVEQVVPEPATLSLLGFGLLGSAAARRRQMRKRAA